ncbi:MAG: MBL fold metallo-hydrolase [Pyrinomonadaceae bacterium]|nr:MBL fold metallo-hydrolase [Pyrinomonadaceae bacterium]
MQNAKSIVQTKKKDSMQHVASDVTFMTTVFVNLYMVGTNDSWVLVDTGLPKQGWRVRAAAEERFGKGARPEAIILTHGHFDHAGNALGLAEGWDVPIYPHELELPYLTGKSDYPPQDPTVGGALAQMSRLFPHSGYDFGSRVQMLPRDGSAPGLPEWRVLHTPGHTAGHISLFRERDRVLLAGDALATVNQESVVTLLTLEKELRQPPAPLTTDWGAARRSIEQLAKLQPSAIAAGHGLPITEDAATKMNEFAAHFAPPPKGRYVREPARTNENGVVALPPPVPDPVPKLIAGAALALGAGALIYSQTRRRRRS